MYTIVELHLECNFGQNDQRGDDHESNEGLEGRGQNGQEHKYAHLIAIIHQASSLNKVWMGLLLVQDQWQTQDQVEGLLGLHHVKH